MWELVGLKTETEGLRDPATRATGRRSIGSPVEGPRLLSLGQGRQDLPLHVQNKGDVAKKKWYGQVIVHS